MNTKGRFCFSSVFRVIEIRFRGTFMMALEEKINKFLPRTEKLYFDLFSSNIVSVGGFFQLQESKPEELGTVSTGHCLHSIFCTVLLL